VGATLEERFEVLIGELLGVPGVTPPQGGRGFGRSALRVDNKIFAMLVRGRLVLKLPRARVDALIAAGEGIRFDANKGTPMKEWLSLDPNTAELSRAGSHEAVTWVFAGCGMYPGWFCLREGLLVGVWVSSPCPSRSPCAFLSACHR
jgi:hypothetical protein